MWNLMQLHLSEVNMRKVYEYVYNNVHFLKLIVFLLSLMVSVIWVSIRSGYGLVPWGTQP